MAAITEDYVSFETAKLLKEKGFDARCPMIYTADGEMLYTDVKHHNMYAVTNKQLEYYTDIIAPTQAMAMKWLREVHNLFIQICIIPHTTITMEQKYYFFTIHKDRRTLAFRKDFPSEYYFTYEEAAEAAIKYSLENLI